MTCTVSNSFLWSLFDILLVLHFSHFKHWLILPCDCPPPPPPTPPPPPPWSITHTITGFALSQHLLVIDCCCLGYGTKPGQPLLPLTFPPPPPRLTPSSPYSAPTPHFTFIAFLTVLLEWGLTTLGLLSLSSLVLEWVVSILAGCGACLICWLLPCCSVWHCHAMARPLADGCSVYCTGVEY